MPNVKYRMGVDLSLLREIPDLRDKINTVAERYKNAALVQCALQPLIVACDGNCETAGDLNPDVIAEGADMKLKDDSGFPNKYCVRNCLDCYQFDPTEEYSKLLEELQKKKK